MTQTPEEVAQNVRHAAGVFEALIGVAEMLESLAPFEEARDALLAEMEELARQKALVMAEQRALVVATEAVRREHREAVERMASDIKGLEKARDAVGSDAELLERKLINARVAYENLPPVQAAGLTVQVAELREVHDALTAQVRGAVKALKL